MEEFEKTKTAQEISEIENEEEIGALDDTAVEETAFETTDPGEAFYLSDEPEEKKSGFPLVGVIAIIVAVAIAVGCFLIVRHNRQKQNGETILITNNVEETVSAEIRDGEIYINDQKIDPDEVGIDPDDPEQVEEFVSSVNSGSVTLPGNVAQRVTQKSSSGNSSSGNSRNSSSSAQTTAAPTQIGEIVKPRGVVITSPVAKSYEIGYSGKVSYGLTPLGQVSSSQRGVTITSSDPGVVSVDHLGNFKAVGKGTATITVQSKVTPTAKASVTLTIVDVTTTIKVVVPTITTSPKTTTTTTTTTTKPTSAPTSQHSGETVAIDSMSFKTSSGIDGSNSRILSVGGTIVLGINYSPSNASNSDVTFSSSNPSVCTVDSNGRVYARGVGTATIVVAAKKGSASNLIARITVE